MQLFSETAALECLPQPDIDLVGVIAWATPHGHRNIESDRPNRRVVTHARSDADANVVWKWLETGAHLPSVGKRDESARLAMRCFTEATMHDL